MDVESRQNHQECVHQRQNRDSDDLRRPMPLDDVSRNKYDHYSMLHSFVSETNNNNNKKPLDDLAPEYHLALFVWLLASTLVYGFLTFTSWNMCRVGLDFVFAGVVAPNGMVRNSIFMCGPTVMTAGIILASWWAYCNKNYIWLMLLNSVATVIYLACVLTSIIFL